MRITTLNTIGAALFTLLLLLAFAPPADAVDIGSQLPGAGLPTARFTYACDGLRCSFDASSSTTSTGAAVSAATPGVTYAWQFGDGQTSSQSPVVHLYASAGTFSVVLTFREPSGLQDTETKVITVQSAGGQTTTTTPSTTNQQGNGPPGPGGENPPGDSDTSTQGGGNRGDGSSAGPPADAAAPDGALPPWLWGFMVLAVLAAGSAGVFAWKKGHGPKRAPAPYRGPMEERRTHDLPPRGHAGRERPTREPASYDSPSDEPPAPPRRSRAPPPSEPWMDEPELPARRRSAPPASQPWSDEVEHPERRMHPPPASEPWTDEPEAHVPTAEPSRARARKARPRR